MSGLILCRTKVAENPFHIDNMDLNIYTLEELCYYIYNNIYLIGMDLASTKLVEFIRIEICEDTLADRLEYLIEQRAGLAEIVITIFKYVDYYSVGEIEEIRGILETLNTQNVLERLKARADSFLGNKCYYSAIKNYSNIIKAQRDTTLPGIFYARVYHNIGVAYAKLFLFKQSVEYFDIAYKIGQHEESKKCSMAAMKLASSNEISDTAFDEEGASEDEYVIKREIETLMDNALYSDEYRGLEAVNNIKEDGQVGEYYKALDAVLDNWKRQYSKYTT